jgi:hypothetical protein
MPSGLQMLPLIVGTTSEISTDVKVIEDAEIVEDEVKPADK